MITNEEIKKILKNGQYSVIFPKSREDEKAAMRLAENVDNVKAVASFVDEENDGKVSYGVIVDLLVLDNSEENDKM